MSATGAAVGSIAARLAAELGVVERQIDAAVKLLDDGATVPFVARYRKEITGGLDDVQLRALEQRLRYLRELEDRREVILQSVGEQGKLDPKLERALLAADTKTRLEDLYLPYKPKRRSRAQTAREAGLEPLARRLRDDPALDPERLAADYLNADAGVDNVQQALDGARQILMETFAEDAELLGALRDRLWRQGVLSARLVDGQAEQGAKFSDYFAYAEAIAKIPSHRALALLRGRNEGVLQLQLDLPDDGARAPSEPHPCERQIARHFGIATSARSRWLSETVRWAWRVKIFPHLDLELKQRLRDGAEDEAIRVFARNLHDLLLAAPAGPRPTLGLDPGLRSGVKVAVIDATGRLAATATIYPHAPQRRWERALAELAALARDHRVELIAIGNGTASRETDRLAAELIGKHPELKLQKLVVSEAGASVYSASELASAEMPDVDVALRGAASIARRLQDPLAELVKIDPKAIGVGQYQHDVSQAKLAKTLDAVVEDCVNAVGVDVNTASPALLRRVAGLSVTHAANLVAFRDQNGAFTDRKTLLRVPRLGAKTFEQAAGFLRVMNGANPLDASAVHPEAYPLVERISAACGRPIARLIGDADALGALNPNDYTDRRFGLPTVRDVLGELEKPGRDPRPQFVTAAFRDGIETLADLQPQMRLEGVVTNVTNFGAFVDIGVHQDGLVHVSALADRFVKDPRDVVKTGDVVSVRVLEVDRRRKRIALSMKKDDACRQSDAKDAKPRAAAAAKPRSRPADAAPSGALADAFTRARGRGRRQ